MDKNKVVVGISGGVDSAVCAYLLKNQGYEVIGMTMIQFDNPDFLKDAKDVCRLLNIPFETVDMRNDFRRDIIDNFTSEYLKGRTPNPCTRCNPLIKFKAMTDVADRLGAYYVATGHYAKVECLNGRFSLKNTDNRKDQAYALCNLSQDTLSRTLTPLCNMAKEEVRKIAESIGLSVADKPDSQDICFVENNDYGAFLSENTDAPIIKGNFVDASGKILGIHEGICHYTIGQRKGLNLAMGHPVFVTKIDPSTNEVTIGESEDLFTDECVLTDINYMSGEETFKDGLEVLVKVRYAHKGTPANIFHSEDGIRVKFSEPVRAITPGQTAVIYQDGYIFAGAVIK